jgi:hypothetical protein
MIAAFGGFSRDQADKLPQTQLAGYALRKARSDGYTRDARRKFLEGTNFSSPAEAVESGIRSTQQWCDCLELARHEFRINSNLYGD